MEKIIKIGVIAPRIFSLGGYDTHNPKRSELNKNISKILESYLSAQIYILSSLRHGIENDIIEYANNNKIKYNLYFPYLNINKHFCTPILGYEELLKNAENIIFTNRGDYSPTKYIKLYKSIADDSDVIIYIWNKLKVHCGTLNYTISLNKPTYILYV